MAIINPEDVEGALGGYDVEARIRELESARDRWHRRCDTFENIIKERNKEITELREVLGAAGKAIALYDWFVDSYIYQPDEEEHEDYINHRVMVINEGREARRKLAALKGV